MKNIVLIATACRTGGALTIYKQFISHLKEYINGNRYCVFIHPDMPKPEIEGVIYIEHDTSRHLDRILFDWVNCRKMLDERRIVPDVVLSLQNTGVRSLKDCRTIIYYHQSLPFYPHKWNPFDKEERTLFYYKHIYPYFVRMSLTEKTDVIVQIPFIKRGFMSRFDFEEEKIHVLFPDMEKIDAEKVIPYEFGDDKVHMLYPATAWSYKNHKAIIESLNLVRSLDPELLSRIVVHFTVSKGENHDLDKMIREYDLEQNIVYEGVVSHDVLLSMYKAASVMLFPSEIETLGLPLLEAAMFGLPILVSDLDYAREVLANYDGQRYISPDDYAGWAREIMNAACCPRAISPLCQNTESSWTYLFSMLNK